MKILSKVKFPNSIYLILLGSFITRAVYFMLWPFMSIILYRNFGLSIVHIGLILSCVALVAMLLSFYTGYWSDIIGRKKLLFIGLLCSFSAFIPLIFSQSLLLYLFLLIGLSMSKGMVQTIFKTLIADNLKDTKLKEKAYHLLYFVVNVGGVIGPILALNYALTFPKITFMVAAVVYLVFIIFGMMTLGLQESEGFAVETKLTLKKSLAIVKSDRGFIALLIANFLIMLVYAQIDTTLAQYFSRQGNHDSIKLFSQMLMSNAGIVILFQFPVLKLLSFYQEQTQISIAMFAFTIAQCLFCLTPFSSAIGWYVGVLLLSFSEIILFSLMNVYIERFSPKNLRGAYFGASSLCMLGFAIAPLVGGVILHFFGKRDLFALMVVFCLVSWLFYQYSLHCMQRETADINT